MSHDQPHPARPSLDELFATVTRKFNVARWVLGFSASFTIFNGEITAKGRLGRHEAEATVPLYEGEDGLPADETLSGYEALRDVVSQIEDQRAADLDSVRPLIICKALLDGTDPNVMLKSHGIEPVAEDEGATLSYLLGAVIHKTIGKPLAAVA